MYAAWDVPITTAEDALSNLEREYDRSHDEELGDAIANLQWAIMEARNRAKRMPNPLDTTKVSQDLDILVSVATLAVLGFSLYQLVKSTSATATAPAQPPADRSPLTPTSPTPTSQDVIPWVGMSGTTNITVGGNLYITPPNGVTSFDAISGDVSILNTVSGSTKQSLTFVGMKSGTTTVTVNWTQNGTNKLQAQFNVQVQ